MIASKWQHCRLGDFCETGTGSTPSRKGFDHYFGGQTPWVKSGELEDNWITATEETVTNDGIAAARLKIVPKGAVLIALYGATVGKTARLGIDATTNQAVCHVLPHPKKADAQYVWHALKWKLPEFLAKRTGGAQQNISQGLIRDTQILLPPLPEQKRIAAILDQADAIRRKRQQAQKMTASLMPAAFCEVFGDPGTNPKHWPVVDMGEVVAESQYGTSSSLETDKRSCPILRMNNITYSGDWDLSDLKWLDLTDSEKQKYTVKKGDLLFNRTNSPELVGKTAVWPFEESFGFAGYLIRIRFDETRTVAGFVSAYLNSSYGKALLFKSAIPSNNMSNISATTFRRLPLMLPPLDLQKRFVEYSTQVSLSVNRQQCASSESDSLFQALVQRAFRGEL